MAVSPLNGEIASALIREFVRNRFPGIASGPVEECTPLLASGALDSLGILELVIFIGEKFGIEVADEDFDPTNFETIGHLVQFVERKRAA